MRLSAPLPSAWRREALRTNLWLVPTIEIALAAALFAGTHALDRAAYDGSHLLLEHPTRRLDDAAFELVDRAVRIDDEAGVGRAPHVRQADFLFDVELDHHRGIGGAVFVARKANAAAVAGAALLFCVPARHGERLRALSGGRNCKGSLQEFNLTGRVD